MKKTLVGTRIREQRRARSMTQAALAEMAEISPSYLNLIEHNKRSVAGRVLISISKSLGVSVNDLTEGMESQVLSELHEAAAVAAEVRPEMDAMEEMVGRFPGWSRLIAHLFRQLKDQEKAIEALSDRLTHDPFLGESLHAMLTNVTAIGSTASILNSIGDLPELRRQRFTRILEDEASRLTEVVREVTAYFDHSADLEAGAATPEEELDRFLGEHNCHFAELDLAETTQDADGAIEGLIGTSGSLTHNASRTMARQVLEQYGRDARAMPLARFATVASEAGYNPSHLANEFGADLFSVFRRLATLPRPGISAPQFGLVIANAAGQTVFRRPSMNFAIPRHGSACSLWPLYGAFAQPGQPLRNLLELPNGDRFAALSYAAPQRTAQFDMEGPNYMLSAMLFLPEDLSDPLRKWLELPSRPHAIGSSCRICTREKCAARSEPRIFASETRIRA